MPQRWGHMWALPGAKHSSWLHLPPKGLRGPLSVMRQKVATAPFILVAVSHSLCQCFPAPGVRCWYKGRKSTVLMAGEAHRLTLPFSVSPLLQMRLASQETWSCLLPLTQVYVRHIGSASGNKAIRFLNLWKEALKFPLNHKAKFFSRFRFIALFSFWKQLNSACEHWVKPESNGGNYSGDLTMWNASSMQLGPRLLSPGRAPVSSLAVEPVLLGQCGITFPARQPAYSSPWFHHRWENRSREHRVPSRQHLKVLF